MAKSDDDDVGYGRPPRRSQFKPGQSGNPRGRRSRKKMAEAEIVAMVRDELIELTLKGKKVKVTFFEAAIRKTFHTVLAKGGVRDLEKLLQLCARYGALPEDLRMAQDKAAADAVMDKLADIFDKMIPDDDPEEPLKAA